MEQPLGLRYWLLTVGRRWVLAVGVACLIASLVAGFLTSREDTYAATSVVSLAPSAVADVRPNDQLVRLLVSRYNAVGLSRQTLAEAAQEIGIPAREVYGAVEVVNPPDTANLRITAELSDPRLAPALANFVAGAVEDAVEQDAQLEAQRVQVATEPMSPSSVGTPLRLFVSAVLGVLAALGVIALLESPRPRLLMRRQVAALAHGRPWVALPSLRGVRVRTRGHPPPAQQATFWRSLNTPAPVMYSRQLVAAINADRRLDNTIDDGLPASRKRNATSAGARAGTRCIAVMGASYGAGASTTSALLAVGLARSGGNVLLVHMSQSNATIVRRLPRSAGIGGEGRRITPAALSAHESTPVDGLQAPLHPRLHVLPQQSWQEGDQPMAWWDAGWNEYDDVVFDVGALSHPEFRQEIADIVNSAVVVIGAGTHLDEAEAAVAQILWSNSAHLVVVGNQVK